ncbi:MAG: hypothetical protein H0Z33_02610 [Bacillaceae bacterium]|nr:hypothetical protein [Bacillaceae bacterium]
MNWTVTFGVIMILVYIFQRKYLNLLVIKRALGIILFLELFYLIGHYMFDWPFPTPEVVLQIIIVTGLGVALGVTFARIWPMSPKVGFERVIRTLLLVIPAFGLGMGMQVLMQGPRATQGIMFIFALSTWLGSGHLVRKEEKKEDSDSKTSKKK